MGWVEREEARQAKGRWEGKRRANVTGVIET